MKFFSKFHSQYKDGFYSSLFLGLLLLIQYPFLKYELGSLTGYIYSFSALNELTFWSNFFGDTVTNLTENPLQYNAIVWTLYLMSKISNPFITFSLAPILLTAISFYCVLKILNLYGLQKSWSVLIAFLGMISMSSLPLLNILIELLSLNIINLGAENGYIDLLGSFSSSLMLMSFLLLLFLSLKSLIFNLAYKNMMPFVWALSILIHPALFIFGYSFSLISNMISLLRRVINGNPVNITKSLLLNLAPLIIVFPFIYWNIEFFGSFSNQDYIAETNNLLGFGKAMILYFIFPFVLLMFIQALFKVDPFEVFIKFWPILLLAIIEFLLRLMHFYKMLPIDDSLVFNRVTIYFLHFLYFVPFISIATRKFSYLPDINEGKDKFLNRLRQGINYIFIDASKYIVIITLLLISLITITSIDHKDFQKVDNRAKDLKKLLPFLASEEQFLDKKLLFLQLDDRIIAQYLFPDLFSVNSYILFGSSRISKEFDFLETLYANQKDALFIGWESYKSMSDKIEFKDSRRNKFLVKWLKYNNSFVDNKELADSYNDPNDDFFNDHILISRELPNSIKTIKNLNFLKYDDFILAYRK